MNFYRGYAKTKDKRCLMDFKDVPDENLLTFDQVKDLSEYAGILAKDAILIDVDDVEQSEKLLKMCERMDVRCRILESRSGMHFLFKNTKINKTGNKLRLACGLTADIKSGIKNGYEVLKIEGKERENLYDIFENEEYQELPKWLYPVRSSMDFLDMEAGDGRNDALFSYILTLQSNDFAKEEAKETIQIINDFILKDPLPQGELDVILRDDAFKKELFFKKSQFLFDRFAEYMKSNHHIKRLNNQLHLYQDGLYVYNPGDLENQMIRHIPQLNKTKRKEVLDYLDVLIRDNVTPDDVNHIAFRNGVLNIDTNEFTLHSPEHIITNRIPWDYNPNAYDELTDKTLTKIACGDFEIRAILEEMVGYTMFRRNELGKAFLLTGAGSNGKSTFLKMVRNILGGENISSLDLNMLGDRFSTIMLFNKLANIGDDISGEFIPDMSIFKKIVTGDWISAEQKGAPKFDFIPFVKLFFSTNSIPRMGKGGDSFALKRRLIIVPFNAKFSNDDPNYDPFIVDKLKSQNAMEYIINLGLEGLKRILDNKCFTTSEKAQAELDEYERSNNPMIGFLDEHENEIENEPTNEVYRRYGVYCAESNCNPVSKITFCRQINQIMGLSSMPVRCNGKLIKVFGRK